MLYKKAPKKSWAGFGLKVGVIGITLEVVALGGTYLFYRRLNKDTEFRHYCSESLPYFLEYYYKIGDILNSEKGKLIREQDLAAFELLKEKQKQILPPKD